jgi:hypothetical protein
VATGDINGDGKLDLVVANSNVNTASVLLGNGDGTFQAAQSVPVPYFYTNAVAVGDLNGDGKLDLFVTQGTNIYVLPGNGDGTFQSPIASRLGFGPNSVAVGDFNGDGKADLALTDDFYSATVSVALGNGDGTFQAAQSVPAGASANSVAVGDLNGDGKLDLVEGSRIDNHVSVLLGNGDGSFQLVHVPVMGGGSQLSVAVGDFNGDGKTDMALAHYNSFDALGNVFLGGTLSVALGNGDGAFQAAQDLAVGVARPTSVAAGDFNGDGKPDLAVTSANEGSVNVLLNQPLTTTTLSGPVGSTYAQSVTYTATVTSGATPVTAGTVTFLDGDTPISPALALDANGQASFSIPMLNAGSHTITASFSNPGGPGITGFGASAASTNLVVSPLPLSASAVNVGATAGAPFSGTLATFANPDPYGGAASYTALITWGDGSISAGTITGTGTLAVSGTHTYADPGSYAASVQITHNLGNTTMATVYPTATVTALGQAVQNGLEGDIGLWHNKNGQALINAFNGGPDSTALSSWLVTNFANLYGYLAGYTNAQVALYYQDLFAQPGSLEAQVLATALNIYATTESLGGTVGRAYGFTVTATGLGADSFNVGADGTAFGVADNSTRNVYELLAAVDAQAVGGVLYNGDNTLRAEAGDLFAALLKAGKVS